MKAIVQPCLDAMLHWYAPRQCLVCGRPRRYDNLCGRCRLPPPVHYSGNLRCSSCWEVITGDDICPACRVMPLLNETSRYLWPYEEHVRALICSMKFEGRAALATYLGELAAQAIPTIFSESSWDTIEPMPTGLRSLWRRGYCPPAIIASHLRAHQNLRVSLLSRPLLSMHGKKSPQAALPNSSRIRNVRSCFSADRARTAGRSILLIDDVTTTGASAAYASQALLRAGASKVDFLSIARASSWSRYRQKLNSVCSM